MQQTLGSDVSFAGIGLHSGRPVRMTLRPAPAGHGIVFRRTDAVAGDPVVPALWHAVTDSRLCSELANSSGVRVSTVEHLMAALAGTGVHNALILIDGPEVPILDGSSRPFVTRILQAGVVAQGAPVRALKVLKPVEVTEGSASARLDPAGMLEIAFAIDFAAAAIGHQEWSLSMANGAFVRELCDSRTFCMQSDVEAMRAAGRALGGTYDNAVVFDGDRILSPGGLRRSDEPVRHKMLDALGDLALAGGPILGRYSGVRAGHALTNRLLRALFADPESHEWVDCTWTTTRKLPGVGVAPADVPRVA